MTNIQTPVLIKSLGPAAVFILQFFIECQEGAVNTPEYKKYHNHFCKSFTDIEVYLGIKEDQAQRAIRRLNDFNLIDIYKTKRQSGYRVNIPAVEALYAKEEANLNHNVEVHLAKKKQVKAEASQRAKKRSIATEEYLQKAQEILKSRRGGKISEEEAVNALKEIGIDTKSELCIVVSLCVKFNRDLTLADFNTIKKFFQDGYGPEWTKNYEAYEQLKCAIANADQVKSFSKYFGIAVVNSAKGMKEFKKSCPEKETPVDTTKEDTRDIVIVENVKEPEVIEEKVVVTEPKKTPASFHPKRKKQMTDLCIEYLNGSISEEVFYNKAYVEAGYYKHEAGAFLDNYRARVSGWRW